LSESTSPALDTIVALATPRGQGAIAIVRLSGPQALSLAEEITRFRRFQPRYAHLLNLYDLQGGPIDRALVIYFAPPKSFTGEAVVEFQLHGGDLVATALIEQLRTLGARMARPGEFTTRAVLSGKMDPSQAEAAAALIGAKSKAALNLLARQLEGGLGVFVQSVREQLIRLQAHTEVSIDYAEEDLPEDLLEGMLKSLDELIDLLKRTLTSSRRRAGLLSGYRVAIIGKPNAGKSSLLNALLQYERAIVSDQAGTTRDAIEESIHLGSHTLSLVDTAGLRQSGDAIERQGIAYARRMAEGADAVIALFDRAAPIESEDRAVLDLLARFKEEKPVLVALNKSDRPAAFDTAALAGYPLSEISAKEGAIEPLLEALEALLSQESASEETLLVSARQTDCVAQTLEEIHQAKALLETGDLELFGYHCAQAAEAIGAITRPVEHDEVLDAMFGEFCLGK
jgi:tRNA modification GTPase